jgi:hypothetical protein
LIIDSSGVFWNNGIKRKKNGREKNGREKKKYQKAGSDDFNGIGSWGDDGLWLLLFYWVQHRIVPHNEQSMDECIVWHIDWWRSDH